MHGGSRQSACPCFVALDLNGRQMYWTQKGSSNARQGRILPAGIDTPDGDTAPEGRLVAVIFKDLPEPMDLELDLAKRTILDRSGGSTAWKHGQSGTDWM
jgi:hypothetical protein